MADPKIVAAYKTCIKNPRANIHTYPMPEGFVGGISCQNTPNEVYIALPNGALLTRSQLLKECQSPADRAQYASEVPYGQAITPEVCTNAKINAFMGIAFPSTTQNTNKKPGRH